MKLYATDYNLFWLLGKSLKKIGKSNIYWMVSDANGASWKIEIQPFRWKAESHIKEVLFRRTREMQSISLFIIARMQVHFVKHKWFFNVELPTIIEHHTYANIQYNSKCMRYTIKICHRIFNWFLQFALHHRNTEKVVFSVAIQLCIRRIFLTF